MTNIAASRATGQHRMLMATRDPMAGTFITVLGLFIATVPAMYMHPHISSQISGERRRDMMAQADRWRLVRRVTGRAGEPRPAEAAGRHPRHARRAAMLTGRWLRYRTVR
jgi:hypothetical protein